MVDAPQVEHAACGEVVNAMGVRRPEILGCVWSRRAGDVRLAEAPIHHVPSLQVLVSGTFGLGFPATSAVGREFLTVMHGATHFFLSPNFRPKKDTILIQVKRYIYTCSVSGQSQPASVAMFRGDRQ